VTDTHKQAIDTWLVEEIGPEIERWT